MSIMRRRLIGIRDANAVDGVRAKYPYVIEMHTDVFNTQTGHRMHVCPVRRCATMTEARASLKAAAREYNADVCAYNTIHKQPHVEIPVEFGVGHGINLVDIGHGRTVRDVTCFEGWCVTMYVSMWADLKALPKRLRKQRGKLFRITPYLAVKKTAEKDRNMWAKHTKIDPSFIDKALSSVGQLIYPLESYDTER